MPIGSIRIYSDVSIEGVELTRGALTYNIRLSQSDYSRVRWEKSKRLLNGTLLVFTPDTFKTAFFATVAQRDLAKLADGMLGIALEGVGPEDLPTSGPFLMVECEVYFEAYRLVRFPNHP